MRDYRLPKSSRRRGGAKPVARSRSSRPISSPRPAARAVSRSLRRPSRRSTSAVSMPHIPLIGLLTRIGLAMVLLIGLGFGLFKTVVPQLLPLRENRNIVIVSSNKEQSANKIMVAHFKPNDGMITAVTLPADQSVTVAGGFGQYPLRSVWPLLEMEKKDDTFVRSAFSFALGEVIDGVVVTSDPHLPASQFELHSVLSSAIKAGNFTGVGWRDQLALTFFTAKVSADQVKLREVSSWEGWLKYRSDLSLQYPEDACPVAVVNTTQQAGLARSFSQVLEQSGYTVVRVTDDPDKLTSSQIGYATTSETCVAKAQALSHLFPISIAVQADPGQAQTYRAEIVLILGTDIQTVIPIIE